MSSALADIDEDFGALGELGSRSSGAESSTPFGRKAPSERVKLSRTFRLKLTVNKSDFSLKDVMYTIYALGGVGNVSHIILDSPWRILR